MNYPGSKKNWAIQATGFTHVYDLFMGSAAWSLRALETNPYAFLIGAESNPIQFEILGGAALDCAERAVSVLAELRSALPAEWNGQGRLSRICPEAREDLGRVWQRLVKDPWNAAISSGVATPEGIVAQLIALQCGINAKLPCFANGLNVSPSAQKIFKAEKLLLPKRVTAMLFRSYEQVEIEERGTSLVLIDPPYALPAKMRFTHAELTRCYPGHLPYSDGAMALYTDSIQRAVSARADEIRVANYWSEQLESFIELQATIGGYKTTQIEHFRHERNYKLQYQHGKRSNSGKARLKEVEWILSKCA